MSNNMRKRCHFELLLHMVRAHFVHESRFTSEIECPEMSIHCSS